MAVSSNRQTEEGAVADLDQTMQLDTAATVRGLAKYRHTILFAITALIIMAVGATVAATKVNSVISSLADKELIKLAEDNTTKNAQHIQSMITGRRGMPGMPGMANASASMDPGPDMATDSDGSLAMTTGDAMSGESENLTLDLLIGPTGLPVQFSTLVEGLGVLEATLLSPSGEVMWSTETHGPDEPLRTGIGWINAQNGTISSTLVKNREFVDRDGIIRVTDAVETYVPLLEFPNGPVVGVLEIIQDVGTELGQGVDDTKATVVWTTAGTMAGLFLALLGFVVVSGRMIYRSNERQLALVASRRLAERNRANEEAERARALESSNQDLEVLTAQLVETQGQLVRSEKLAAVGQWSGGVAHDLRNPLGAIKNANYMLKKRLTSDGVIDANSKLEKYIEIIDLQVIKSNKIITDLMTFVNVGAFTLTETHLDQVLAGTLDTMQKQDNVELLHSFDNDLSPVMGDGDQLQRVFLNLANNAQEAMPDGGQLTITAKNIENQVEIDFIDTGEGISEEKIEKIFDPLFTSKTKGTGLGLAVCHEIILRHGGTITVRSNQEPSGGTIFEIRLPAATQRPPTVDETTNDE